MQIRCPLSKQALGVKPAHSFEKMNSVPQKVLGSKSLRNKLVCEKNYPQLSVKVWPFAGLGMRAFLLFHFLFLSASFQKTGQVQPAIETDSYLITQIAFCPLRII